MESLQHGFKEDTWLQSGGAQLEEEHVGVHHGVAEVTLDVGHGLALDLEPVPGPHVTHDLVEPGLQKLTVRVLVEWISFRESIRAVRCQH